MFGASRPSHLLLLGVVGSCLAFGATFALALFGVVGPPAPRVVPVTVAPVKTESRIPLADDLPTPPELPLPATKDQKAPSASPRPTRKPVRQPAAEPPIEVVPLPAIDPRTPLAELVPPPSADRAPVYLGDDLEKVPELKLEAPPAVEVARKGTLTTEQWKSRKAKQIAAALNLNEKEEDGFLKELSRTRPDLAGLPFLMGDACRTKGERAKAFKVMAEDFTKSRSEGREERKEPPQLREGQEEKRRQYREARVAVLAQNMVVQVKSCGAPRAYYDLKEIDGPEATRELARAAAFSTCDYTRGRARKQLTERSKNDSTDALVKGLRYPWPAVAKNAAKAIVELKRKDLIPQLEAMLDEPDPRGPRTEKDGDKEVTVAHELVRINHHRNCLLCHAPAEHGKTPEETLVAPVPLPSEELPYYGTPPKRTGLLVRIDVTYLRQDFSKEQWVKGEPSAWREIQRFDFVVRKRVLAQDEARDLRKRLEEAGNPYRRAITEALRKLKCDS